MTFVRECKRKKSPLSPRRLYILSPRFTLLQSEFLSSPTTHLYTSPFLLLGGPSHGAPTSILQQNDSHHQHIILHPHCGNSQWSIPRTVCFAHTHSFCPSASCCNTEKPNRVSSGPVKILGCFTSMLKHWHKAGRQSQKGYGHKEDSNYSKQSCSSPR